MNITHNYGARITATTDTVLVESTTEIADTVDQYPAERTQDAFRGLHPTGYIGGS